MPSVSGFGSGLLPVDLLLFWMVTHFSGRVRVNSWDHYRPPVKRGQACSVLLSVCGEIKDEENICNSESISGPHLFIFQSDESFRVDRQLSDEMSGVK